MKQYVVFVFFVLFFPSTLIAQGWDDPWTEGINEGAVGNWDDPWTEGVNEGSIGFGGLFGN